MIKKFWDWFTKQQSTLRKIADGDYDLIDNILIELGKIRTGLAVEFEENGDIIVMTISADGVEDNFEIVGKIVDQAPKIAKWAFIALRQPVPRGKIETVTIKVKGIKLDPKKLMFLPIIEENHLYIQIFSSAITEENKNDISYGCLMLLDNLIGEYDCVKKVKGYEFYNLRELKDFKKDLKPLTKIRDFLDDYYGVDA